MMEYELRYRRSDGRMAFLFVMSAPDDEAATEIADGFWMPDFATLEIYRGCQRIRECRNPRALN